MGGGRKGEREEGREGRGKETTCVHSLVCATGPAEAPRALE